MQPSSLDEIEVRGKELEVPGDVQGATILPGFINTHVHDSYNKSYLEAWAQAGVTTVFKQIPTLSFEEASAIAAVVHERGVRLTSHVTARHELEIALDIGVDDLAHMLLTDLPDALIDRVIEADVTWVPILELWKCVSEDNPVSSDLTAVSNLRCFVNAGGKVALGTDYGGYTTRLGIGMPILEIEMMQDAGMTVMQIIVAATKHAAHVCGLGAEVGTIEAGKIADVLVVNGDPLVNIHALADARLVLQSGTVIRQ